MTNTNVPEKRAEEKNITDKVLEKIRSFQAFGDLTLPKDYSAENAIKSAYLILVETTTADKKPVLQACSQPSIANALLNMVVQGLNPMKGQCTFIAYGNKLTLQREYAGTIALAKRVGGVADVKAQVIYEGDVFKYSIDPATGRKVITEHTQSIDNILPDKLKGAYATVILNDGTVDVDIMTMAQIRKSWEMGQTKGQSPAHRNFPDQMAMKTVIGRACKLYISSSNDSALYDEELEIDARAVTSRTEALEKTGMQPLYLQSDEDIQELVEQDEPVTDAVEQVEEEQSPEPAPAPTKENPAPNPKDEPAPAPAPPSWINPMAKGAGPSATLFGNEPQRPPR
jgi:recombination protein RecT